MIYDSLIFRCESQYRRAHTKKYPVSDEWKNEKEYEYDEREDTCTHVQNDLQLGEL